MSRAKRILKGSLSLLSALIIYTIVPYILVTLLRAAIPGVVDRVCEALEMAALLGIPIALASFVKDSSSEESKEKYYAGVVKSGLQVAYILVLGWVGSSGAFGIFEVKLPEATLLVNASLLFTAFVYLALVGFALSLVECYAFLKLGRVKKGVK